MTTSVRCSFYLVQEVSDGFTYEPFTIDAPGGGAYGYWLDLPPTVGDLIFLFDSNHDGMRGEFVVVRRRWMHSQYGSMNWPYTSSDKTAPASLDVLVRRALDADTLFAFEAPEAPEAPPGPELPTGDQP